MDVCNLKGWGLRVNKLWSDADYMSQRGPTCFAVFTGTTEQNLTLVRGTVRQLTQNENTLYWYFQRLPVNVPFEQYEFREASLTNPVIGTDGNVTVSGIGAEYYSLTQGAGVTPTPVLKNHPHTFSVIKQDADSDAPLAGVHFALHRQVTVGGVTTIDFNPMPGYADLVTDANGVVPRLNNTLPPGTYELREVTPPSGYQGLSAYIRFTVSQTGEVTLGSHPEDVDLTTSQPDQDGTIHYVMTILNSQRIKVSIWKTDGGHTTFTTGASFALYRASGLDDAASHPIGNAQPIMTGETDSRGILYLGELQLGEYCLLETQRRVCVIFTNNNIRRRLTPERGGRRLRLQLFEAMALRQNLNDN